MFRGDAVVTLHPGLREVHLPHITKSHAGLLVHGDDAAAVERGKQRRGVEMFSGLRPAGNRW